SSIDVGAIAVATADPAVNPDLFYRVRRLLHEYDYFSGNDPASLWTKCLNLLVHRVRTVPRSIRGARQMSREIRKWALKHGVEDKLARVPHHLAHAACAYWAAGFDRALAVTLDGQGEGITSQIYLVESGDF